MTVLAFHDIAAETLPELEGYSFDEHSVELVIDTFDELIFFKNALVDVVHSQDDISEFANPVIIAQAKELRDQVLDDVTEMQISSSDRLLPVTYEIEEPQLVVEAIKLRRKITKQLESTTIRYPEYDWLRDPDNTHEAALVGRAFSSDEYKKEFQKDSL